MVEKDKLPEFSLEDILREFGSNAEDIPEPEKQTPEVEASLRQAEPIGSDLTDLAADPVPAEAIPSDFDKDDGFDFDIADALSRALGEISKAPESPENEVSAKAPIENILPTETFIAEALMEETPVKESLAEETPVEETPMEEASVEETPMVETPAEETPAEETPAEETPMVETPAEETPMVETPAEETPMEEPADIVADDSPDEDDVQVFTPKASAAGNSSDTIRLDSTAVRQAVNAVTPNPAETIRIDTDTVSAMTDETVRIDTDAVSAMTGETVRIDTDTVSAMTGETVRIDTDAVSAMTGETVRIDTDTVSAMTDETVRIDTDTVSAMTGDAQNGDPAMDGATVAFIPIADADTQPAAPEMSEEAEPFSEGWEPKYEEPIGEYVPPEPITFRPHSRLHEMKKKLIAGPERRYYALLEEGVGKLQVAIFISALIVILSAVSVGLNQMSMVQPGRMRLLVFGELFAMLFSAVLASDLIFNGLISIFRGRFTLNSLLAMTFFVCIADGIFCLKGVRVPYCAAFCLEATAALWAEYQRRSTEMGQMDTLRKATRLNRISQAPGCFNGKPGFYTEDGEVEDFMDTYKAPSRPEKNLNLYALLAFLASIGIGVTAFLSRHDIAYGLQMWSAAILAAAPATIFLTHSRPIAILERRLHRYGVVLCGWKGVQGACGNAVVPLDDSDLFPAGSVKVNGVKIYSSKRDTDQIIAYTTALVERSGTILAPLFSQMLESRYGQHFEVENFRVYENGGLGGNVCGEAVLVGSRAFLQEKGVHLPDGALVNQGVYTAINGELCSVCAMAFGKLKGVATGLTALTSQRKLTPMMVTNNFLLDEAFVQEKFGISTGNVLFPSFQQQEQVITWQPDPETACVCALSTQESLAATGIAITGARTLEGALKHGTSLHILGGILGMLIVLVLQFVDGGSLLTPANLLLFELIWAIPGMLITEWTRRL